VAYASSLKLFASGLKKEASFTGSFAAYFVHCVISVITWTHFLFKLLQASKYGDFGFIYYLPYKENLANSFTILYEISLKNTYGKKAQSTKYTVKKLETHFLTGTAGFELMREFSSCDNFSPVFLYAT